MSPKPGGQAEAETADPEEPWLRPELSEQEDDTKTGKLLLPPDLHDVAMTGPGGEQQAAGLQVRADAPGAGACRPGEGR